MTRVFKAGIWTEDGSVAPGLPPYVVVTVPAPSSSTGRQEVYVVAEGALPALPLLGPAICIELLGNGNRRLSFTDGVA